LLWGQGYVVDANIIDQAGEEAGCIKVLIHHAIRRSPQAKKFYDRKKSKSNGALVTKALGAKWSKGAYYVMKRQEPFDLKRLFS